MIDNVELSRHFFDLPRYLAGLLVGFAPSGNSKERINIDDKTTTVLDKVVEHAIYWQLHFPLKSAALFADPRQDCVICYFLLDLSQAP